jgi:hypothetical protein
VNRAVVYLSNIFIFPLLFPAQPVRAQPPDCKLVQTNPKALSTYDQYVCKLGNNIRDRKTKAPKAGIILEDDSLALTQILVAKSFQPAIVVQAEDERVDVQVGGGSSNAGSTSLVSKGSVPAILGFAVENGALTQSQSGTTITFRGDPVGILQTLSSKGFIQSYTEAATETQFLRRFSFALSFDANRGSKPGTFSGDLQQLSSYNIRVDLVNQRDPRNSAYILDWSRFVRGSQIKFTNDWNSLEDALVDFTNPLAPKFSDPALEQWFERAQLALAATSAENVDSVLNQQLNEVPFGEDKLQPKTLDTLKAFEKTVTALLQGREDILAKVAEGPILTFDYTNYRQVNAPNLSTFKLIGERYFYSNKIDVTGNTSLTILDKLPAGMNLKKVRSFDFAAQIDIPFSLQRIGFVWSVSGKYQRMLDNAMMPGSNTTAPNTKGDIAIGQFKLTIPVRGSGVKIPISLTIANRTDLIKESDVRGNVGITLDLDTLFAKFKP